MDSVEQVRLVGIAYRMLGSLAEAEDAVQDAYLRWFSLTENQRSNVRTPMAWMTTVVSRICLDYARSARARRERYVGPWLPEPLASSAFNSITSAERQAGDPAEFVPLQDSLSTAVLVALEQLSPAERIALVLHDLVGYQFAEIAEVLDRTPHACRQLASVARRKAKSDLAAAPMSAEQNESLVRAFRNAWLTGDVAQLVRELDPDAVALVDGGGLVSAPTEPYNGADSVAALLVGIRRRMRRLAISEEPVNGAPGLVVHSRNGKVVTAVSFGFTQGSIGAIWAVRNPEKLRRWVAPIDVGILSLSGAGVHHGAR